MRKKRYISSFTIMIICLYIFFAVPAFLFCYENAESLTESFYMYDTKKSDLLYVSKNDFYKMIDTDCVSDVYIDNYSLLHPYYNGDLYFAGFEGFNTKYYKVTFTESTRIPTAELNDLIANNSQINFKNLTDLVFFEDSNKECKKMIISIFIATTILVLVIGKARNDYRQYSLPFNEESQKKVRERKYGEKVEFLGYSKNTDHFEDVNENNENKKYFNDIAGLKEVKKDVKCLVDFIKNKEKYIEAGAKLPKGVILYGPPGTGKTLLAKAIAGEANIPFIYANGSSFIEMYVGVGPKRIRELFEKARKKAPCIIFIDEIDAIGSQRTGYDHSEDRKTLDALLTEMDGFKETENILVIAATNRIEDLDNALMRPGRFTDKYCVPLPETVNERMEVINLYIKNKKLADDVDLNSLAKDTIGFSPAKIEALLNSAAIISVQDGNGIIRRKDLDKAMTKLLMDGHMKEDNSERNKKEIEIVAYHEAGHALVGHLFGKDITKVTVIASTSGAGGVTFSIPKERGLSSARDVKGQIMELYAGRMAELMLFDGDKELVTTGATNDIERASKLIDSYVKKYGMSDKFGLLNLKDEDDYKILDNKIEVAKELEKETYELLKKHKDVLTEIAESLIQSETIYEDEINLIFEDFNI